MMPDCGQCYSLAATAVWGEQQHTRLRSHPKNAAAHSSVQHALHAVSNRPHSQPDLRLLHWLGGQPRMPPTAVRPRSLTPPSSLQCFSPLPPSPLHASSPPKPSEGRPAHSSNISAGCLLPPPTRGPSLGSSPVRLPGPRRSTTHTSSAVRPGRATAPASAASAEAGAASGGMLHHMRVVVPWLLLPAGAGAGAAHRGSGNCSCRQEPPEAAV